MSDQHRFCDGYEENYQKLLPMLQKPDLVENACRLGARPQSGKAHISYLGRDYIIARDGVYAADNLPADANIRSTLIYYATSDGAGELSGEFALLHRLTGMIDGRNSLGKDLMKDPLIREFGGDCARFAAAVTRLGGEEQVSHSSGKHIWHLLVLPKIMMQFIFYEADSEFPVDIQLMFDTSATRFLEFECLAFLTGSVVQALIGNGQK